MVAMPLKLFQRTNPPVSTTPEIDALIAADSPVAIGVSGGKDSSAVAFAVVDHLDKVGHRGPRVLIHADLGVVEWADSMLWCQKLAERLGLELIVTRRVKGDMMDRWEQRWSDNCARYADLSCVQLILPWSTPGMRFCTSEMKTAPICRELIRRFPGRTILSVTGIRREESSGRANTPTCKVQPKLESKTHQTAGVDWHAIPDWTLAETLAFLEACDFPLHPAYVLWLLTRVSCAFCIMSSIGDLRNAARCPANHALYRRMVDLEIVSTFAFHGDLWLGDVAPELLSQTQRDGLELAKARALKRRAAESHIPADLLYTKGWPDRVPTWDEAKLLCDVRRQVADTIGLVIRFSEPADLIGRYEELMAMKKLRSK